MRRNARDCVAHHETYGWNPSLFGRPIYDYAVGQRKRTRQLLGRKQRLVAACGASHYVETSHAFLKSWFDLATEFFPRLKIIHLVRDPLKVAKSEAYREAWIKRLRLPLCHYRGGDSRRYFLWSLTGREPIFAHVPAAAYSRLAWYLVQWIEIENRAMQFLDKFAMHTDCFTLHAPSELNEPERVTALFDFLKIRRRSARFDFTGRRNRNPRLTEVTAADRQTLAEVVHALPAKYRTIFSHPPYCSLSWAQSLTTFDESQL